jgi:NitT/TauT family transport system ATP-binding protein
VKKNRLSLVPSPSPEKEPILEVINLGKMFPVGNSFLSVFEGLEFQAARGEMICILGRSGCGKSTLLKILAGFMEPTAGSIRIGDRPVRSPGRDRCVVFQEDALFPWLTVFENVAFGLRMSGMGKKSIRKEVERFLSLVGLNGFRDYLPREISGGMKQRVALARVLIIKPQVLLMDEPFASLDAQTREEMQNLLLDLWKNLSHTILFVTHDVHEAVILADRILLMDKNPGRIRESIGVDLPRPRNADQDRFPALSRRIHEKLRA